MVRLVGPCSLLQLLHEDLSAPILDDCRHLQDFGKVIIEHCFRETNMIAQELASYGRGNPPTVWSDALPTFILNALANDVSLI